MSRPSFFRPAGLTFLLVAVVAVVAVVVAVAAALGPSPAGAATVYTIRGAGNGHGVGMSQYGAYGMARRDFTYRKILAHYYRGAKLGPAPTDRTRVLLAEGVPAVEFSGAARVPGVRPLDPDRTYRAVATREGQVEVRSSAGKLVRRFPAPLALDGRGEPLRLAGPALNGISDGEYRGTLMLHPGSGGLTAINVVGLEDYLRGVVPSEMPSSWSREALKAQAVAARSYALATARTGGLFDQYPDQRSQVYKGVGGEAPETDAAIEVTRGEVLFHRGRIAIAFFSSSSGGRTESAVNAFNRQAYPYLRSVSDPYDRISPHFRWSLSLSREEMEHRLGALVKGRYEGIEVLEGGDSPRVLRAEVRGSKGRKSATGATLRAKLGLRDSWASFGRIDMAVAGAMRALRSPASGPAPAGVLTGRVKPEPRGGRIALERRERGGWRRALAHADRRGAFRVSVDRPGRYRVRAGGSGGPAVRVATR
jgi:stage II sporulation protein D